MFLVPGADFVFTYGAEVDKASVTVDDLRQWATQADSQVASLPAPPVSSAGLVQLTAPKSLSVKAGQSTPLPAVQGKMSDGSAAPPAALSQVTWASSNPAVAQVSGGNLVAIASGSVTLTATLAGVRVAISVSVSVNLPLPPAPTPPPSPHSAPTGSPSSFAKVPVYELNMSGYYYFYTANSTEISIDESEAGYRPVGQGPGGVGFYGCSGSGAVYVHRLVNYSTNLHEFTISDAAVATYKSQGYTEELPNTFDACPASTPGVVPVYRLWLGSPGATRFTTSMAIVNQMVAAGWQEQGVAFYAYPP
ncbi:MAG TPA: Ig-like domain-containing protein, partial [Actinomycetota bacterium]|nr:Ig-like domain-containing protein [Actinomycetota bacterium]